MHGARRWEASRKLGELSRTVGGRIVPRWCKEARERGNGARRTRSRIGSPLLTMNTTTTTKVTHEIPLADAIDLARMRCSILEAEFQATLPFATDEQAAACVAAAEGFQAVKVPGLGTQFRLSASQKLAVKEARQRHSATATEQKAQIAEKIANCTTITRFKFKANREGKISGQVAFTL